MQRLLIANRGEIAIRIARAAAGLGIETVAVYAEDDARCLHVARADAAAPLRGAGAGAYLDAEQLVAAALANRCDAVHPGYGFLSENAAFAHRCVAAGLAFVGPRPELLALFGDKLQARALARRCEVPLLPGTEDDTSLAQVRDFLAALGDGAAVMIKAVAGGGGRGMRAVTRLDELEAAYARCRSEAQAAFGNGALYVERLIPRARHIEIQIVGDGNSVSQLGERECTLQRRQQKLVEMAPSPTLAAPLRERIADCALRMATAVRYEGLGTFEFLLDADSDEFVFIEANPRLQVEHTVTEAVFGVDLVAAQLQLASGRSLAELGLDQRLLPLPKGFAVQLRVNMETMTPDGAALPGGGALAVFEPPAGPGVRVDTFGYAGYAVSPAFDSLLAKVIVHARSHAAALALAGRALTEFRVEGVPTNIAFLRGLLARPEVAANRVHTRYVEEQAAALVAAAPTAPRFFAAATSVPRAEMAVLPALAGPPGTEPLPAPLRGRVVTIEAVAGTAVPVGAALVVLEAMKMEHVVAAPVDCVVGLVTVAVGETVEAGQPLLFVAPGGIAADARGSAEHEDPDAIRPDLAEVLARREAGLDAARAEAVARRHRSGRRTARENIDDLCDAGSFIEYGALALASQRHRRTPEELIEISPADGLVAGIGAVNGEHFDDTRSRCLVLAYDYTVFAGTQGYMNHKKKDRLFKLAEQLRLPVVAFAEGGGGRPGDDWTSPTALETSTFAHFARLGGLVPRVGIVAGRCFAGNAALLGCCDVIIATQDANIGMGGPAMIEGGGLGVYRPEEVGPVSVQAPNGVIDVVVPDEAAAVRAAKRYLGYFQGAWPAWACADQRPLRQAIPANRVRAYDIRPLIDRLADSDSVLELRAQFGLGMITALIRVEGRPLGLIANNPLHLGGAIDADAADKAARFMQLCDAFGLPLLTLIDTPGFMVGPEAEKTALVRHVSRLFAIGASLSVPLFSIALRKGYGLGAQAMAGGSFSAPVFTVAWPTGEFGAMGLEGAVRLGYRKELAAIDDEAERQREFERMVAAAYQEGKALNTASYLELDDVIDPADSRRWLSRGLRALPEAPPAAGKRRAFIDTW